MIIIYYSIVLYYLLYVLSFEKLLGKRYGFTIITYNGFKYVDGFYMMTRFHDNIHDYMIIFMMVYMMIYIMILRLYRYIYITTIWCLYDDFI